MLRFILLVTQTPLGNKFIQPNHTYPCSEFRKVFYEMLSLIFVRRLLDQWYRGEPSIETIALLDQGSKTIENHWTKWLNDPKTLRKKHHHWKNIGSNGQKLKIFNGDGWISPKPSKSHGNNAMVRGLKNKSILFYTKTSYKVKPKLW